MASGVGQRPQFGKRQKPPHHIIIAQGDRIRRFTLPGWTMVAGGVGAVVLTLWTTGATGFILFRDDFIAGMVRRQAAMQYEYEGKITTLKTEISRLQSKQLVDGQAFSDKVETLVRRQASLESRQSILQSLADMASVGNLKPPLAQETPPLAADIPAAPRPLPEDGDDGTHRSGKQALFDRPILGFAPVQEASMFGAASPRRARSAARGLGVTGELDAVSNSLDRIETNQLAALSTLKDRVSARNARVSDALEDVGLDADKLARKAAKEQAEGGPYIPLNLPADATPFEIEAYGAQAALATADNIDEALTSVPLRRPFPNAQITSPFGVRIDPFLGTGAIHAGIDFREQRGAAVRATAAGQVSEAGWYGGYGNMVEISHGNGLSTRYGHMSEILVSPGEKVTIGQIIGRVGSTGRSTGPHLHYETRINGQAVDPMRFLHVGQRIAKATEG